VSEERRSLFVGAGLLSLSAVLLAASGSEWFDAWRELRAAEEVIEKSALRAGEEHPAVPPTNAFAPFSSELDSAAILRVVSLISARAGVRIVSSRDASAVLHKQLVELPTELVAEGDFSALVGMLDQIEASASNIRVRRAEFRGDADGNSVSLACVVSLLTRRENGRSPETAVIPE